MKTSVIIVFIFGLLTAGCTTTYLNLKESSTSQIEEKIIDYQQDEDVGAEIILSIKNGEEISGELLSVRESSVIICTEHSATEVELSNSIYPIRTVQKDDIKELTIEGSDYTYIGAGIGVAAGTGIGLIAGLSVERTRHMYADPVLILGLIGFLVGIVAGPTVGYFLSTDDIILEEIPPGYDLSVLKPISRYPDEEPEYLRALE